MAWKEIPGNPFWYWKDDPSEDKLENVDGIRTKGLSQIFSQVRRAEDPEDADRGEISATYWNAKVGVLGVQDASYYANLPSVGTVLWTPAELGADLALWLDASDTDTIILNGSNVSAWGDKSGNGFTAEQATASFQPLYQASPARVIFDKTNDVLVTTLPNITGTMVLSTPNGTAAYEVDIPAGSYEIGGHGGDYMPDDAIIGQIICDTVLSSEDKTLTIEYMQGLGGGDNYGAVTDFSNYWRDWSEITVFPLLDTSSGTNFSFAWYNCTSLTSFPLIDTSSGTNFSIAWRNCSGLTSFPLLDTSSGTNFSQSWRNCSGLTSFPLINTSSGTNFSFAWIGCSSLTSFPLIDTSSGTNFSQSWNNCSSLTSFPLINTSSGTNFSFAWIGCSSLTSFPLIDTSSGANLSFAWFGCSSLTSFPLIDTSSGTNFSQSWRFCSSLTTFPANFFDNWTATPLNNCFVNTWDACINLTATSVENILNSIDTSGRSAPASGVDITIDYNAGSGTPNVSTAVTNLKSRGWTITLNGVAQ